MITPYQPEEHWLQRHFQQLVAYHRHHAILLTGERGVGKNRLAKALAYYWLDRNGQSEGVLKGGGHPDLHVLTPPNKQEALDVQLHPYGERYWGKQRTVISTDAIGSLIDKLNQSPMMAASKIALIVDADTMSISAANAILKVLEEPFEDTRFILTTRHVESVPATVLSRCIHYPVSAVNSEVEEAADWRILASNAPLMLGYMQKNGFDQTYELIEKVVPVALTKPGSIGEAARLLAERKQNGLWQCLYAWVYLRQCSTSTNRQYSRGLSDFSLDVLRLSHDARQASLDVRLQLHRLFVHHCPLNFEDR